MDAIRAAGAQARRRPARRRRASATGSRSMPIYGLDITVINPHDRSDLLVHDRRSRRQDPHGLLEPLCDGQARRTQGPFRRRVRATIRTRDRHGIVTPSAGLLNPNHYLAVAIRYLLTHRPDWPADAAVGKTLVSSSMIDRVVHKLGPPARRSAGRLQVVCARIVRRIVLLRRRGERRSAASCAATAPSGRRTRTDRS